MTTSNTLTTLDKSQNTEQLEIAQPIIESEARKLRHLADQEDLEQEGYLAVLKQDDWLTDPEIRMTARWAMLAYISRQNPYNVTSEDDDEDSEDDPEREKLEAVYESEVGPDSSYNEAERAQLADKAQQVLGQQGEVLRRYYGIRPHSRPYTLDEIRMAMHLSRTQVFRMLQLGVAQLSDLMV